MPLDEGQRLRLAARAETLLGELQAVAEEVRGRLSVGQRNRVNPIAAGTNPMVDGSGALRNVALAMSSDRLALERITREPFIARVTLRWNDDNGVQRHKVLFVTRPSAAGLVDVVPDALFAGYGTPLGRVAELRAGKEAQVYLDGRKRPAVVEERVRLRPEFNGGAWDGLDDRFDSESWAAAIDSLKLFLQQIETEGAAPVDIPDLIGALLRQATERDVVHQTSRRHAIQRIALRDQPVLDEFQGDVFRLPMDQRLVLLGPAGTGKTTTLIHRLAQKRMPEALTDEERSVLDRAGLSEGIEHPSNWVMFSPSELLRQYLRDAFSKAGVPASQDNLNTWQHERLRLGRAVLKILRSGESRGFQIDDTSYLADSSSVGVSRVFDAFSHWFDTSTSISLGEAYRRVASSESLSEATRTLLSRTGLKIQGGALSLEDAARLLDGAPELQEQLRVITETINRDAQRLGNRLVNTHSEVIAEIMAAGPELVGDDLGDDDDDEDAEDTTESRVQPRELRAEVAIQLLLSAIRRRGAALAAGRSHVSGRAGRVVSIIGERLPADAELKALGRLIATRADLRAIVRAPRRFVMGIPAAYARFRRDSVKATALFGPTASDAIRKQKLGGDELDVLILLMLRNARRLLGANGWRVPPAQDWLVAITEEHRLQVMVDEATDFSAPELACMIELSQPRVRSWFACGDFNQRITSQGIQTDSELAWIGTATDSAIPEVRRIRTGYRQSKRLRELAGALCEDTATAPIGVDDVEHLDVTPVLGEGLTGESTGLWIAERIIEIEDALGMLPSIAVFVDGDERIDAVVESARGHLAERNISIVGCKEGRVVGDEDEVRVFDAKYIKGLEFEAVLFIGIDDLANRVPDLFLRFFYVGVGRAATYLGVTCSGTLPQALEAFRGHFTTAPWA